MSSTTSTITQQSETALMATNSKKSSIKKFFCRIFSRSKKGLSEKDLKNMHLEAELAKSEADREAQKIRIESLVSENQRVQKGFEEERQTYLREIEKLKYEKKEAVHELNCDKRELIRELQTAHQITTDLKLEAQAEQKHIQKVLKMEMELLKDIKDFEEIRKKSQAAMRSQLKKETEKTGELFAWQSCEICLEPFGEEKERTPRILGCGHTFCLECSEKLVEKDYVKCPLDRTGTQFKGDVEKDLPKNFSVLNMCI